MNGIGIGLSVALGWAIGAALAVPDAPYVGILSGMLFFGGATGFAFHLYQWALRGVRLPFNRP